MGRGGGGEEARGGKGGVSIGAVAGGCGLRESGHRSLLLNQLRRDGEGGRRRRREGGGEGGREEG